jgi:hypothetical protein
MKPIETGKIGETISAPSVADYLAEICKEDNVDVNEYLAKHNETRTITDVSKVFKITFEQDCRLNPSMEYTWKDRVKSVWIVLSNLKYSSYNPFDFKTYRECGYWRNDGYYPEKSSTPWQRFRRFIIHQKSEIKWAWNYTPEHIKHFKKNKPRIGWFENKLKDLFFLNWDDNKNQTIKELKENGYQVEDNRIWHEPIPQDDNKRII